MKREYFYIVLFFFIMSCNDVSNQDIVNNVKPVVKTSRLNLGQVVNPSSNKMIFYSYILGKVLMKHPEAKTVFIDLMSNDNVLDFEVLLSNPVVNAFFLSEIDLLKPMYINCIDESGEPEDPLVYSKGGDKLKVGENAPGDDMDDFDTSAGCALTTIQYELETLIFQDCYEIYSAALMDLSSSNFSVYLIPHPFEYFKTKGYKYTHSVNEENVIEPLVVYSSPYNTISVTNVLVVRPYRNENCTYDNIDVDDFAVFFGN